MSETQRLAGNVSHAERGFSSYEECCDKQNCCEYNDTLTVTALSPVPTGFGFFSWLFFHDSCKIAIGLASAGTLLSIMNIYCMNRHKSYDIEEKHRHVEKIVNRATSIRCCCHWGLGYNVINLAFCITMLVMASNCLS